MSYLLSKPCVKTRFHEVSKDHKPSSEEAKIHHKPNRYLSHLQHLPFNNEKRHKDCIASTDNYMIHLEIVVILQLHEQTSHGRAKRQTEEQKC